METENASRPSQQIRDTSELHSDKVRKMTGEIPRSLTRLNTVVIIIILAALAAAGCLVPYPHSEGESIIRHLLGLP